MSVQNTNSLIPMMMSGSTLHRLEQTRSDFEELITTVRECFLVAESHLSQRQLPEETPLPLVSEASQQIASAKQTCQSLFANFKREHPELAGDEELVTFEQEVLTFFRESQSQVAEKTSQIFANQLSETSWQVERWEATFRSLQGALNQLLTKDNANRSLKDYIEAGEGLSPLENEIKELLHVIQEEVRSDGRRFNDKDYCNAIRHRYQDTFFKHLRSLLRSENYQRFINESQPDENFSNLDYANSPEHRERMLCRLVRELSGALYAEIDLEPTNFHLVESWVNCGSSEDETAFEQYLNRPLEEFFSSTLIEMRERIGAVPKPIRQWSFSHLWNGFKGQINVGFDPNTQGNPIHNMGEIRVVKSDGEEKRIANLAFGSQTWQPCWFDIEVAPEFSDGFLEDYRQKGKAHLYVFHQRLISPLKIQAKSTNAFLNFVLKVIDVIIQVINYIPILNLPLKLIEWIGGNESYRGEALIDLANEERMRNTFYFLALPKDSRFYNQTSSYYSSMEQYEEFKKELIHQFFEMDPHESGIYISPNLIEKMGGEEEFQRIFNHIVDAIHEELFDGRETLTVEERKNFIEMVYVNLERYLLVNPEGECFIDSFNTSCRADIDRGMSAEVNLQTDTALKQMSKSGLSQEVPEIDETKFKREIAKTYFARAIQVCVRPILEHYFERSLQTIQFLSANMDKVGTLDSRLMSRSCVHLSLA